MRSVFLILSLAASQAVRAQVFKNVEVGRGSYILSSAPTVRQQGGLYLRNSEQRLVRDLAGNSSTLTPQQVSSFRLANKQFVSTGGFQQATACPHSRPPYRAAVRQPAALVTPPHLTDY